MLETPYDYNSCEKNKQGDAYRVKYNYHRESLRLPCRSTLRSRRFARRLIRLRWPGRQISTWRQPVNAACSSIVTQGRFIAYPSEMKHLRLAYWGQPGIAGSLVLPYLAAHWCS